jgi:hypothetical protein
VYFEEEPGRRAAAHLMTREIPRLVVMIVADERNPCRAKNP